MEPTLKIILAALDDHLADAWRRECSHLEDIEVYQGSILDVAVDALVSPANSFGFMDGGIDALYLDHFGEGVQSRLRRQIVDIHHGELPIGVAEIIETGDPKHRFLIAAPTMRVPMTLGPQTVNPYLATRAALLLTRHETFGSGPVAGDRVADHVRSVAFPGMGTGVGRVPAAICARQMSAAIRSFRAPRVKLPTSWAEASEEHQLLYTDKPVRLQH